MIGSLVRSSYVPQVLFFGKNDVPVISKTCNNPVEVFLRAAGAFFSAKMPFLRFLGHVITLLRLSFVRKHFFVGKNEFLAFLEHVIILFRSSYVPKAYFFGKQ